MSEPETSTVDLNGFATRVWRKGKGPKLGFLMYPNAETEKERLDSLDPANFKYTISARAV